LGYHLLSTTEISGLKDSKSVKTGTNSKTHAEKIVSKEFKENMSYSNPNSSNSKHKRTYGSL
jgi:hypothetical protein